MTYFKFYKQSLTFCIFTATKKSLLAIELLMTVTVFQITVLVALRYITLNLTSVCNGTRKLCNNSLQLAVNNSPYCQLTYTVNRNFIGVL